MSLMRTLSTRPDIWPVAVITVFGAALASAMIFRSSTRNIDVSWRRSTNPHPNENVQFNQHTKFMKVVDYGQLKDERPKF